MKINLAYKHHPEWQTSRLTYLQEEFGESFFQNKTLLELGSYNGSASNVFNEWGAKVTCLEGRQENVNEINKEFPHLNAAVFNSDVPDWPLGNFDIIINWGLFYHLENYHKECLLNCVNHCSTLFFETCVYDKPEPMLIENVEEGLTQSLTNKSKIPTSSWVENLLNENSVDFKKIIDIRLNGGGHVYNWSDNTNSNYTATNRRFYVITGKQYENS